MYKRKMPNPRRYLRGEEYRLPIETTVVDFSSLIDIHALERNIEKNGLSVMQHNGGVFSTLQPSKDPILSSSQFVLYYIINKYGSYMTLSGAELYSNLLTKSTTKKTDGFGGDIYSVNTKKKQLELVLTDKQLTHLLTCGYLLFDRPPEYSWVVEIAVLLVKRNLANLSKLYCEPVPLQAFRDLVNGTEEQIEFWLDDSELDTIMLKFNHIVEDLIFPHGPPVHSGDNWPKWAIEFNTANTVFVHKYVDHRIFHYYDLLKTTDDDEGSLLDDEEQYEGFRR